MKKRLLKLTTVKLVDDSLHIMRLDGELTVFVSRKHDARRVILNTGYPLEHSLTTEHWFGLEQFIESGKTKARVLEIDSQTFEVIPLKWYQRR